MKHNWKDKAISMALSFLMLLSAGTSVYAEELDVVSSEETAVVQQEEESLVTDESGVLAETESSSEAAAEEFSDETEEFEELSEEEETKADTEDAMYGMCGDNLNWCIEGGGVELCIYGEGEMVDYSSAASTPWYAYKDTITSIYLTGDDITNIGNYAFASLTNVTSVTLTSGITFIGSYAFYGCSSLASVTLPSQLKTLGKYAFAKCTVLSGITLPSGIETLDEACFWCCKALTQISFPSSLTTLGKNAFQETGLTSVYIPKTITTFGEAPFSLTNSLTKAELQSGMTTVPNYLFYTCEYLTDVTIPESVTTIGDYSFFYCTRLKSVQFPSSLSVVGSYAFYKCAALQSIQLPDTVTTIGSYAFSACTSLTQFTYPKSTKTCGWAIFFQDTALKSVTFSEGMQTVGVFEYSGCTALETVNLPDSLESIEQSAFSGCTALKEITIPANVTALGRWVFQNDTGLTTINFLGSAPAFGNDKGHDPFDGITATVTYLPDDTWTEEVRQNYGGTITYKVSSSHQHTAGDPVQENVVEATCKAAGSYDEVTYCSACGEELSRTAKTTAVDEENHAGGTEIKNASEATCSKKGYTGDTYCKGCGSVISYGSVIPANGNHSGGTATCVSKAICTVCGQEYGEVNASNHTGNTEIRNAKEATCGEAGYTGDTYCKDCGEKISDGTVIPATGNHTGGTATCVSKAVCEVCGQEYGEVNASGHTGNTEVRNAKEATCGEAGYTGDTYCKDCGEKLSSGTVIPATGNHTGGTATCVLKAICTVCGQEYGEVNSSNHTGDTEVRDAKESTCGEAGYIGDTYCKYCGEKISSGEVIPATGNHTGGTATCVSKAICTVCGQEYGKVNSSNHTGNTEVRDAKEATCGEAGYTGDTYCKDCGEKLSSGTVIPAAGNHTGGAATCVSKAVCSVCGQEYGEVNASSHTGNTEVRNAKEATCGEAGYTGDTYCKDCDEKLSSGTVIPTTGNHTGGSATCVSKAICEVCGQEYGNLDPDCHTGETELQNEKEANCTETGYTGDLCCKGCGAVLESGQSLPINGVHTWKDWVITKAPTTSKSGSKYHICSACGLKETVSMPKVLKQTIKAASSYSKAYGTSDFILTATTNGDGTLSYKSSKTSVATVDETGYVHIVGVGTATITVTASLTDQYASATKKITVRITKGTQQISADADSYSLPYGSPAFNLDAVSSVGSKLTYKSSKTSVATVSSAGLVTLKGAGTATITITAASTSKYNSATKKITVKVLKINQTLTVAQTSYQLSGDASAFNLNAKTDGNGKLSYKSSKTSVVTVSSSGLVTLKGAGTATITITAASTAGCNAASTQVTVTVTKADQEIKGPDTIEKVKGAKAFSLGCSAKTKLTYKSSNTKVATVSSTGKITIKGTGTVTITVTASSSALYNGTTKTITLTVS